MATDEEVQAARDEADHEFALNMGADAKLYIRNAAQMSEETKTQVAEWLRQHALDLLASGHDYAELFTGNFNPEPGTET